jgi:purine-binding chemotaxis protein CheW
MQETATADSTRYLTLTLGDDAYAIPVDTVREILDYTEITRIPQAAPFMRGVVNVRGTAVPVMDLACKLGLGTVQRTITTRIVIMEAHHDDRVSLIGGLADSVREVLEFDGAAIAPPPHLGGRETASCLRGIVQREGHCIMLLDMEQVLASDVVGDPAGLPAPEAGGERIQTPT